jgi:hypothetical protein
MAFAHAALWWDLLKKKTKMGQLAVHKPAARNAALPTRWLQSICWKNSAILLSVVQTQKFLGSAREYDGRNFWVATREHFPARQGPAKAGLDISLRRENAIKQQLEPRSDSIGPDTPLGAKTWPGTRHPTRR